MNYSFASAPTTPFLGQLDGNQAAPTAAAQYLALSRGFPSHTNQVQQQQQQAFIDNSSSSNNNSGISITSQACATDPLNDINSPLGLQYLQYAMGNNSLYLSDSTGLHSYIGPVSAAAAAAAAVAAVAANVNGTGVSSASKLQPQSQLLQPNQFVDNRNSPIPPQLLVSTASPVVSTQVIGTPIASVPIGSSKPQQHMLSATKALSASPSIDAPLPGFVHPAEVFTTPETRSVADPSQLTPAIRDEDLLNLNSQNTTQTLYGGFQQQQQQQPQTENMIGDDFSEISPRAQAAQAALSMLATASCNTANSPSIHNGNGNRFLHSTPSAASSTPTIALGSPFLNTSGEDTTLLSQPHNSIANQLSSPIMMDRQNSGFRPLPYSPYSGNVSNNINPTPFPPSTSGYPQNYSTVAGLNSAAAFVSGVEGSGINNKSRCAPNVMLVQQGGSSNNNSNNNNGAGFSARPLYKATSGLSNASFHNDIVPQTQSESFFAPLDEVCEDYDSGNTTTNSQIQKQPSSLGPQMLSSRTHAMSGNFRVSNDNNSKTMPLSPRTMPAQKHFRTPLWPASQPSPSTGINGSGMMSGNSPGRLLARGSPSTSSTLRFSSVSATNGAPLSTARLMGNTKANMTSTRPLLSQLSSNISMQSAGSLKGESSLSSNYSDSALTTEDDEDDGENGSCGSVTTGMKRKQPSHESQKQQQQRSGTKHKRDMERRFLCDICNRAFARQYNLKTHRLTHFPDAKEARPYKCPSCPKAFTRKHDLQRHAVLHEARDKYKCVVCDEPFPRKDALRKHNEHEHGNKINGIKSTH